MKFLPLLSKKYGRTLFSFGAIQAMQLVIPLLAFPRLGRKLGAQSFGLLMYMALIPPVVALIMEWGLTLGGARAAAKSRVDARSLVELLGAVFSAKIILAVFCALGGLLFLPFIPHAWEWPCAYFMAICLGLCRGISPLWYYQGLGCGMERVAVWDVCSSLLALLLIFLFIHQPDQWARYLFFTSICKGIANLWLSGALWREYRPTLGIKKGLAILSATKTLFGSSFCTLIYNNGAQILLGFFLSTAQMGIIVAVTKMLRALASVVTPFTQAIFPEICILKTQDPAKVRHILRRSLWGLIGLMGGFALAICYFAPLIIKLALGSGYEEAIPILRIVIFAAPLLACDQILGAQLLVPLGLERWQIRVQAFAAFSSLGLAAILADLWGLAGSAFLIICTELIIVCGYMKIIIQKCPQTLFTREGDS